MLRKCSSLGYQFVFAKTAARKCLRPKCHGRLVEDQESPPQMPSRYFEDGRQAFGTPDLLLDLFRVPCRVFNMTGLGSAIFWSDIWSQHIFIYIIIIIIIIIVSIWWSISIFANFPSVHYTDHLKMPRFLLRKASRRRAARGKWKGWWSMASHCNHTDVPTVGSCWFLQCWFLGKKLFSRYNCNEQYSVTQCNIYIYAIKQYKTGPVCQLTFPETSLAHVPHCRSPLSQSPKEIRHHETHRVIHAWEAWAWNADSHRKSTLWQSKLTTENPPVIISFYTNSLQKKPLNIWISHCTFEWPRVEHPEAFPGAIDDGLSVRSGDDTQSPWPGISE
jgi:hypothetical protein